MNHFLNSKSDFEGKTIDSKRKSEIDFPLECCRAGCSEAHVVFVPPCEASFYFHPCLVGTSFSVWKFIFFRRKDEICEIIYCVAFFSFIKTIVIKNQIFRENTLDFIFVSFVCCQECFYTSGDV